jgi:RNA polymerase sigma factor (sigma-70 family)
MIRERTDTESEKVTELQKLNRNDFIDRVFRLYGRKLYSYSISTWKVSEDTAWDLVYKTIYRLTEIYRNYTFESEEKFASFLFRIFINYLKNHYRDNKNAPEYTSTEGIDFPAAEKDSEASSENKKMAALNEALGEMEDWQRLLLLLRSEGRPYSEIAAYVDKPEKQLKVYYQRLKEQITKKLHDRF